MNRTLQDRAVLMRLSLGLPGESGQDGELTAEVQNEHSLGSEAGTWLAKLYPKSALAKIKSNRTAAKDYHDSVTMPWDRGVGILPTAFVAEYGEKMREFVERDKALIEEFLADPWKWIRWAIEQHNGTFDPSRYPGCKENEPMVYAATGEKYALDVDVFRKRVRQQFRFRTTPMPVPLSEHFTATVSSLLGTDTASVDARVNEAIQESKRILVRRLIGPVRKMAEKLAEEPKQLSNGKMASDIRFKDTLVGNLKEIAELAPELNLDDDPAVKDFIEDVDKLTRYAPQTLRDDKFTREEAQKKADALAKKMAAYSF